jgi:hypothetical protein
VPKHAPSVALATPIIQRSSALFADACRCSSIQLCPLPLSGGDLPVVRSRSAILCHLLRGDRAPGVAATRATSLPSELSGPPLQRSSSGLLPGPATPKSNASGFRPEQPRCGTCQPHMDNVFQDNIDFFSNPAAASVGKFTRSSITPSSSGTAGLMTTLLGGSGTVGRPRTNRSGCLS